MDKTILISLVVCIILAGCGGQDPQALVVSSETPEPFVTVTPTQTIVRPTSTPKPTITPTITLTPPYSTKQVLLDYTVGGFHTLFEMNYADLGVDRWSELVLYADGQLIIPGNPYQQKILSKDEINLAT